MNCNGERSDLVEFGILDLIEGDKQAVAIFGYCLPYRVAQRRANSFDVYATERYAGDSGFESGVFGLDLGLELFKNALAEPFGCDFLNNGPTAILSKTRALIKEDRFTRSICCYTLLYLAIT